MNLMEGLTAANIAIGIVKDLRDIDRSLDDAEFKLKLAELTSALADAKVALADANLALNDSEKKILQLTEALDIAQNGDNCPKCLVGRLRLQSTEGYAMMGLHTFGVERWKYLCSNEDCGFEQKRLHDPHKVLPKSAGKR